MSQKPINEYASNRNAMTPMSKEDELKPIIVEFLYIDLEECHHYIGADGDGQADKYLGSSDYGESGQYSYSDAERLLDDATQELSVPFKTMGYCFAVVKVNIVTEEMAELYQINYLPTIRLNQHDIVNFLNNETSDNDVKACVINGILEAIYKNNPIKNTGVYTMPDRIKTYFRKKEGGCGRCCGGGGGCNKGS